MALERFIPKSPDPFIRNSQDFEVAKFGHLNTIIEYVNSYVVTDSLQLAGSGPITSTARYITDSLGNNSAISISTIGVGIGTDAPTSLLDVVRYTTGSVNNNYQFRILNSADGQYPYSVLLLEHNNRTGIGNPGGSTIVIKDGFANVNRGGLGFDYFNSTSYTAGGGSLRLSNDGQGNVYIATNGTDAIRVFKDQGVQIGGISTSGSTSIARLLVKGSGSTSATTSLLVQNSAGTEALKVTDNGSTTLYGLGINSAVGLGAVTMNLSGNCIIATPTSFQVRSGITDTPVLFINGNNGTPFSYFTGNTAIGSTTDLSARLGIKGSGSTSATTSLLVQNSSSVSSLTITDDRTSTFGGVVNITPPQITGGTQFFTVKSGNWPTALIRGFENGTLILGSSTGTFGIDSVQISSRQLTNITFDNSGGFVPNNNINQYGWIFSASYTNAGAGGVSEASMIRMAGNTATAIGNVTLNQFAVKNTINNTAGTTINRGYFYDPTVTSVVNTTNIAFQSTSGSVNINTSTIQASAILQADSTTQGFLPPRVTTIQKNAIATPAAGLVVYDTDLNKLCVYTTAWQTITSV